MTQKKPKTVRRTVIVLAPSTVNVTERAFEWELAGKTNNRRIHRVERAEQGLDEALVSSLKLASQRRRTEAYIIDMELTCRGANRHDFTKFVRSYLPEAKQHFITD